MTWQISLEGKDHKMKKAGKSGYPYRNKRKISQKKSRYIKGSVSK